MENIETKYLSKLIEHFSLTLEESETLMKHFLSGDFNPRLAASILSIISFKGEHVEELAGFAKTLIEQMKKFNSPYDDLLDVVGTGGDNKKAFNISLTSCLILSILKVRVAKQVRHSVSSGCGSADVLKALGVNTNASYEQKKQCLDQEHFVFLN
ncbi:MAG: anthranilate phosphoribosyltransferase, partial [Pseudomonadota bacterium]